MNIEETPDVSLLIAQLPTRMGEYTFCPRCETTIKQWDEEKGLLMPFCPYCGQHIDWA